MAAVRTAHRSAVHGGGVPDTEPARLVLRSHRRARAEAGRRAQQAPPVTIKALRAMVETATRATTIGLRDRAVLVLSLALFGRRSELAALEISDLTETPDGIEVLIRASKTDQDARGAVIAIPPGQHANTDPVRIVRAWLATLAERGITSGRLLRSVDRHGRIGTGLSPDAISGVVRATAIRAGLPRAEIYSARTACGAGGAIAAYRAGAPVSVIARMAGGRPAPRDAVLRPGRGPVAGQCTTRRPAVMRRPLGKKVSRLWLAKVGR